MNGTHQEEAVSTQACSSAEGSCRNETRRRGSGLVVEPGIPERQLLEPRVASYRVKQRNSSPTAESVVVELELGQPDVAEPLLVAAVGGRRFVLGPDSPDALESVEALGRLYATTERPAEARPLAAGWGARRAVGARGTGGGFRGAWGDGLRHGDGANLYGGKWGYDRWEGPFVDDKPHGIGQAYVRAERDDEHGDGVQAAALRRHLAERARAVENEHATRYQQASTMAMRRWLCVAAALSFSALHMLSRRLTSAVHLRQVHGLVVLQQPASQIEPYSCEFSR